MENCYINIWWKFKVDTVISFWVHHIGRSIISVKWIRRRLPHIRQTFDNQHSVKHLKFKSRTLSLLDIHQTVFAWISADRVSYRKWLNVCLSRVKTPNCEFSQTLYFVCPGTVFVREFWNKTSKYCSKTNMIRVIFCTTQCRYNIRFQCIILWNNK